MMQIQVPGITPGVYSLDFIVRTINYFDDHCQNCKQPEFMKVNSPGKRGPKLKYGHKLSQLEMQQNWRERHPDKYEKTKAKWAAYKRGLTAFKRLFGNDNTKPHMPYQPRTCHFCGSVDSVHAVHGVYVCDLCKCKHHSTSEALA